MSNMIVCGDVEMPFFLTNSDWYTDNPDVESERGYILTDEAPQEAIDSYNEFYEMSGPLPAEDGKIYLV